MQINNFSFQNFSNKFSIFSERIHNSFSKVLSVSSVFLRHASFFPSSPQLKKSSEPILRNHQGGSEKMDTFPSGRSILKTKHTPLKRKKVQFENKEKPIICPIRRAEELKNGEIDNDDSSAITNTTQKMGPNPNSLFPPPLLNRDILSAHTTSSVIQIRDHWGV